MSVIVYFEAGFLEPVRQLTCGPPAAVGKGECGLTIILKGPRQRARSSARMCFVFCTEKIVNLQL